MEFFIILLLIVLNGVFSMSEAAVIASRRARLQQQAEKGDKGAQTALELAEQPNRFLSTVQVGITLIGVLTGAFGGATIAAQIAALLAPTPLGRYADGIAFALVVIVTTYLSLIIGELVPKRIALHSPERIAAMIARPMYTLSVLTSPLITFLGGSTSAVLFLLGMRPNNDPPVTEEEIKTMMQQGIEAGVFDEGEQDMVSGIFRLGERRVGSLMTPRTEVVWLNLQDTDDENRAKIMDSTFSRMPVCDGELDDVVGMLNAKDMLSRLLAGGSFDIRAVLVDAQFVPESMSASKVLDMFRKSAQHIAVVIGEYGGTEGLITIQDLLEEIVGDVEDSAPEAIKRDDGTWLIDGMIDIDEFKELFSIDEIEGEHESFSTLGGFVMSEMGNVPQAGDSFDWTKFHVEVMDMDGNRVDKVLVTEIAPEEEAGDDETKKEASAETEATPDVTSEATGDT